MDEVADNEPTGVKLAASGYISERPVYKRPPRVRVPLLIPLLIYSEPRRCFGVS